MPKIVIDILPPEEVEESKPVSSKKRIKKPRRKIRFKKLLFLLILILIIGVVSCSAFSKVEIEIKPKMDDFESGLMITTDKGVKEADLPAKIIPGYLLEEQNSLSQKFSASGKVDKDKKAEGVIKIYNDYSALSQPLRADTRFMAASGEVFRTPIRIVIPGKKIENGKEVPGSIDVKVIADRSGPEYNIESTSFSIPGLVGTPLYAGFYGKSFGAMSGGFRGETPQVTKEDLEKAEATVIKRLEMEGKKILEKKAADSNLILLEEAFRQEVKATSSLVEVGSEVESFEFSAKVKSTALVFEKEKVEELISTQIPEGKKLYKKSLNINWKTRELNLTEGKITLNLEFSGKIYSDIDQLELKKELKGKTLSEAKSLLRGKAEISGAELDAWPFWVKKIPRNLDKIVVKLKLD